MRMFKKSFTALGLLAVVSAMGLTTGGHEATTAANEGDASSVSAIELVASTGLTSGQRNAIRAAKSYLSFSAFSRSGLIDQLRFEGYSTRNATFAVDYIDVSWRNQAYKSAKAYLKFSPFSLSGLIDQLEFEGFTHRQAVYGAKRAL